MAFGAYKIYKYILGMSKLTEPNFIFGDLEQESEPDKNSGRAKQDLQQSYQMENSLKKQQTSDPPHHSSPIVLQSKLIIVQQAKSPTNEPQANDLQHIQLAETKKKALPVEKIKVDMKAKQQIIYPYQESEQLEEQPQSSIRKLYKAMKRQQNYIRHEQQQEKMENNDKQGHHYQSSSSSEEEYEQDYKKKTLIESKSLTQLILFNVPQSKAIKCLVKIAKDQFFSMETVFHFYLLQQRQLLMTARKKNFRPTSKYVIYGKQQGHIESLAIVRSNFLRTEYKLTFLRKKTEQKEESTAFSSSVLKMTKVEQQHHEPIFVQDEQCYLNYESNFFGLVQQRVEVIKPRKALAKTDRFSDIKAAYQNCQYERVQKFQNRLAERNHEGKLVMDFRDNKIAECSKNMIVEDEFGTACLLFGKRRDDIFMLDIMSPFNFLQGFFVGICSLDRKLFVR